MSYFKRATAYLSLGRNNAAVEDFSTILNLKPDFDHVLVHRARIYLKEGILHWAIQDLENYTSKHNDDKEAAKMVKLEIGAWRIYTDICILLSSRTLKLQKAL